MVIRSLLDTDLYKFTMMQVVLHHFPSAQVQYRFWCRTPGIDFSTFIAEIEREIDSLCELRLQDDELDYLRGLRFIKSDFVDFLGLFHLPRKCIQVSEGDRPGELAIVVQGAWLHTILFEIPVLAIVNEVYFRHTIGQPDYSLGRARLVDKVELVRQAKDLPAFRVAEYGTRRRFSHQWHDEVLQYLKVSMGPSLAGTSNVYMAKRHGPTPRCQAGFSTPTARRCPSQKAMSLLPLISLRNTEVMPFDIGRPVRVLALTLLLAKTK